MKILLAGDSWAWGDGDDKYHPRSNINAIRGITYHLTKNYPHIVQNVSKAGCNNYHIVNQLKSNRFIKAVDYILVILTDPLRNVPLKPINWFKDYDNLLEIQNSSINRTYKDLNNLGLPIYCMGGTNKLDPDIKNYPNLINLCPSLPEFLVEDWTAPKIFFSANWHKKISTYDKVPVETLDKLIEDYDQWLKLSQSQSPYFSDPDKWHPNHEGYKKITEMVKEKLNLP